MKRSSIAVLMTLALCSAPLAQTGGGAGSAAGGGAGAGAATGSGAASGASPTGAAPGTGSGGPALGTGTATTTNSPATGGVPTSPGALNNQIQSNQNQQVGTGARSSGAPMQPSTLGTGGMPAVSGSARDAGARANQAARCEQILAKRNEHKAEEVVACERSTNASDPAAELDRRLQRENSRAVNSICRGC